MRAIFKSAFLIVLSGLLWMPAYGQLQIGDTLPEDRMEELRSMSSADFPALEEPARLYILDFWSRWCGSCIVSFPKVEAMQYQFREDIRILAINPWNDEQEVRELFDRYHGYSNKGEEMRKERDPSWQGSLFRPRNTSLPASNGDESWLDLFDIEGVPHHVWLNGEGRIIAVTSPYDLNAKNIAYYLRTGTLPKLAFKPTPGSYWLKDQSLTDIWGEEAFRHQQEGLKIREFYKGDGGSIFGYQRMGIVDSVKQTIRYSFVNTPIAELYKAAWAMTSSEFDQFEYQYGQHLIAQGDTLRHPRVPSERLLWEVSMPEYYIGPLNENYVRSEAPGFNDWSFRAKFCAELELPLEQQEEAGRILLEGLNRYFEQKFGISAHIEPRKRYCLVLKKDQDFTPLTSAAEERSSSYDVEQNVERYLNYPFDAVFLDYIPYRIDHGEREPSWRTNSRGKHFTPQLNRGYMLFDETGITENIDIALHVVPDTVRNPIEALNARLEGTGLQFEKEVREIDMLIISDRVN